MPSATPPTDTPTDTPSDVPRPARRRRVGSWVLLVLGGLLAVLSVASVWVRNVLLDTDRYVETVAPLAEDEDMQRVAAAQITAVFMDAVDVEAVTLDLLGPRGAALAPVFADAVERFVEDTTYRFFSSEEFADLWVAANRAAHTQIDALLTGGGEFVSTEDGKVVLDLAAVAGRIRILLADQGLTVFDPVPITDLSARIELIESDGITRAQGAVDLLRTVAFVLPLLALAALAGSVALGGDRRRGVWRAGITLAVSMAALLLAVSIGRRFYLDALSGSIGAAAAESTFDTLTRFLRQGVRFLFAVGILVALGVWITGPGSAATRIRAVLGGAGAQAGGGIGADTAPGGVATWIADHRHGVRAGILVVLAFLALTRAHPSIRTLLVALLLGGALFAVVAVVAARVDAWRAGHEPPESEEETGPEGPEPEPEPAGQA